MDECTFPFGLVPDGVVLAMGRNRREASAHPTTDSIP